MVQLHFRITSVAKFDEHLVRTRCAHMLGLFAHPPRLILVGHLHALKDALPRPARLALVQSTEYGTSISLRSAILSRALSPFAQLANVYLLARSRGEGRTQSNL